MAHAKVDVIAWNRHLRELARHRPRRAAEGADHGGDGHCRQHLHPVARRDPAPHRGQQPGRSLAIHRGCPGTHHRTYAAAGFECPAERHLGIRDNFSFGAVSEATIGGVIEACRMGEARRGDDPLHQHGRGADGRRLPETADGPMILDSVAVTLWGCLVASGARPDIIRDWGRLFTDPRCNPA